LNSMIKNLLFKIFAISCLGLNLLVLVILFIGTLYTAWPRLSGSFLTHVYSRNPEHAGIYASLMASFWLMGLSILMAVPIGTGAGIYMEEYLRKNRWSQILEANIINLAGIPPVIYGILGLELVTQFFHSDFTMVAGAFVLSLMVLPSIIVNTRESFRSVPPSLKAASIALGASKWQTIERVILPYAFRSLVAGVLKAIARVAGTTAPLLIMGGLAYIPFAPSHLNDPFTALPVQIFDWILKPKNEFSANAAAAILILLCITVPLNLLSLRIRKVVQGGSRSDLPLG